MKIRTWAACAVAVTGLLAQRLVADRPGQDFGLSVEQALKEHALELFGVRALTHSALGPFDGDAASALQVAEPLTVTVVSTAIGPNADMIALWPNDDRPTHLFTCVEGGTTGPSVQRVDLSQPANANVTTIVRGTTSCDPIRRTPWGTIVFAEESSTGGFYEILNPAAINTTVLITSRAAGTTTDPRVVKRKAVGQVAFEGQAILPDGTMYFGDELRPGNNPTSGSPAAPGGAIYKFVPTFPRSVDGPISDLTQSPLAVGQVYGLAVGTGGDVGQGADIGVGRWVAVDASHITDANGNISLRAAAIAQHFTGYYRPEDMDLDPIAFARGQVRACWTNTGRMTHGGNSVVEGAAVYGEVLCLTDSRTSDATIATNAIPQVSRFIAGNPDANYFDNVAFQPQTGNLVVLEDGEVEVVKKDGTTELRGNDLWMCLPDGRDKDVMSDGCIRFASLRDTTSEPTGFVFTASGRTAYVNLQHRGINQGALLKITGFRIPDRDDDHDRDH
jgi:secreted PhoX family phosphatase